MGVYLSPDREEDALMLSWPLMQAIATIMSGLEMAHPSSLPAGMECSHIEDTESRSEGARSWREPTEQGIPLHKLSSNDGWDVSREECQEALAILEAKSAAERAEVLREEFDVRYEPLDQFMAFFDSRKARAGDVACLDDLWRRWIQLLTCAAAGDGFAVW